LPCAGVPYCTRFTWRRRHAFPKTSTWWALTSPSTLPVSIDDVVDAFQHYMREEGTQVARAEFVAHLHSCLADRSGFCSDMLPLLRRDVSYEPVQAGLFVQKHVLARLPE